MVSRFAQFRQRILQSTQGMVIGPQVDRLLKRWSYSTPGSRCSNAASTRCAYVGRLQVPGIDRLRHLDIQRHGGLRGQLIQQSQLARIGIAVADLFSEGWLAWRLAIRLCCGLGISCRLGGRAGILWCHSLRRSRQFFHLRLSSAKFQRLMRRYAAKSASSRIPSRSDRSRSDIGPAGVGSSPPPTNRSSVTPNSICSRAGCVPGVNQRGRIQQRQGEEPGCLPCKQQSGCMFRFLPNVSTDHGAWDSFGGLKSPEFWLGLEYRL